MRTIRTVVLTLAAVAATALLGTSPGFAQNGRWCIENAPDGGGRDCMYDTYRQCMAARAGIGGFCGRNPLYYQDADERRYRRQDLYYRD